MSGRVVEEMVVGDGRAEGGVARGCAGSDKCA
jgi:hypothetical protein